MGAGAPGIGAGDGVDVRGGVDGGAECVGEFAAPKQHLAFVGEVPEEGALREACSGGDLGDRRRIEALLHVQVQGRLLQAALGDADAVVAQADRDLGRVVLDEHPEPGTGPGVRGGVARRLPHHGGQLVDDLLGPGVLPDDRVVDRLAGVLVPHERRLTLVGDAEGHEVGCRQPGVVEGGLQHRAGALPDFDGIVLDPPGPRQDLLVFELVAPDLTT